MASIRSITYGKKSIGYLIELRDVTSHQKYLENLELFDVYEGSQIQAGFKSVAYSLTFRAADHTLSDDEINPAMEKIIAGLTEIGVTLRA